MKQENNSLIMRKNLLKMFLIVIFTLFLRDAEGSCDKFAIKGKNESIN